MSAAATRSKKAAITVRNLPLEVHRALKKRARQHGVSAEAEVRTILRDVVLPEARITPADILVEFGRKYGELPFYRDKTAAQPADVA